MKAMLLLKQAKIRAAAVLKLHGRYISMHQQPCDSPARAVFSAFALLLLDSQSAEYIIEPPLNCGKKCLKTVEITPSICCFSACRSFGGQQHD